jgi:hypothetical protein
MAHFGDILNVRTTLEKFSRVVFYKNESLQK